MNIKNKVSAIKFSNGNQGTKYVLIAPTKAVEDFIAGNAQTIELFQRSLKNCVLDKEREFTEDALGIPLEQQNDDSSVAVEPEQMTIDNVLPLSEFEVVEEVVNPVLETTTLVEPVDVKPANDPNATFGL